MSGMRAGSGGACWGKRTPVSRGPQRLVLITTRACEPYHAHHFRDDDHLHVEAAGPHPGRLAPPRGLLRRAVVGSAVLTYAGAELGRGFAYWRGLLGVFIMLIMVAAPSGVLLGVSALWGRARARQAVSRDAVHAAPGGP